MTHSVPLTILNYLLWWHMQAVPAGEPQLKLLKQLLQQQGEALAAAPAAEQLPGALLEAAQELAAGQGVDAALLDSSTGSWVEAAREQVAAEGQLVADGLRLAPGVCGVLSNGRLILSHDPSTGVAWDVGACVCK